VVHATVRITWRSDDRAIRLALHRQREDADDLVEANITAASAGGFSLHLRYLSEHVNTLPGERIRFGDAPEFGPVYITVPGDKELLTLLMTTR
jgi:hypothetical protein